MYWVHFVVVVDGTHEDFYDVSSINPFAAQSRETLESPVHPECRSSGGLRTCKPQCVIQQHYRPEGADQQSFMIWNIESQ